MNRSTALLSLAFLTVASSMGLRAQDPDGGVGRARPLASYRPAVPGIHGLVTAGHPLAAMAGMQVLLKGGNAIDAAVAVGATLNMMEPQMNGIGGNGFMTIFDKKTGKVYSLAMAGSAPMALKPAEMTPEKLDWGMEAGVVPGNFGGYLTALQRFGTMDLAQVLAPAIDYAEHGYPMDRSLAAGIASAQAKLAAFPTTAKIFLPNGHAPVATDIFKNPDLATTLKKTVEAEAAARKQGKSREAGIQAGFDRFYKGDIAQEFDRFFKENHGLITAADMAAYKPEWAEPLHSTYRGYDIYSNPSSSRGGFELEMALNLVEPYDLGKMGLDSAQALHLEIEAIKVSKSDIYHYVGDSRFTKVPTDGLLSKSYAASRDKLISPDKAMVYPDWGTPALTAPAALASVADLQRPAFPDDYEIERDTTSFSIVDQYGNAVACTPTLGGGFGNGVVVGNTGLLLNNGMRLGSTSPYPDNVNYVKPGQRPLLNNSPTIVLKDGKLAIVYGTPGGETIGQTEFEMLVNLIDFHLPVQQAVESPPFRRRRQAKLLQARCRYINHHRGPHACGLARTAHEDGPQVEAGWKLYRRSRRHAGYCDRPPDRRDDRRRGSQTYRLRRRLVNRPSHSFCRRRPAMRLKSIALSLLSVATAAGAQIMPPKADMALARDIYKQFVEIQSGFTTGSTTPVAEAAAARLRAAGFPDADIFLGGASPKKENIVVRYHGTGAKKPILLLAHTDVVEAKREDWSMDPFVLNEKDGFFYGRGTGDDKAQAAVWIANLIRYKQEGFKPDRDIIVALTADEEGGGPYNGVAWLIANHRDLIDADLALNEGGWGEEVAGKKVSNDLQVSEKYVINYTFEVRNKGGHSSMPIADNAIYHLAGALQRLSAFAFPLKTNEVTAAYFTEMAKIVPGPVQADLTKVASGSQPAMERVAAVSPNWNATLRTTCVATMLAGGHASNALPQLATATVNCRVLPEDSPDYVLSTLKKVVGDDQVSITASRESAGGAPSPMRPDVLKAVKTASEKEFPGVPVVPIMVAGATDGRPLRVIGIPTYGIQGFFYDRDDIRFHGRDERLGVQSFYQGQEFLYDLVKILCGTPN